MKSITRISITFPPDLLRKLDEIVEQAGYETRSKAIQDSAKMLISDFEWLRRAEGTKTGILTMIYDHEVKGLNEAITDIQHDYSHVILATMHIHLSKRDCLEALAIKGEAKDIRRLTEELKTKKGVKEVKLTVVST